jgi:hypothetical protein
MGTTEKAAVTGAAAGATAGTAVGRYTDKQTATRAEAVQKYSYDAKEQRLEIEGAVLSPQKVAPGASVESSVQYTALAAGNAQQVRVTEVRTLVSGQETIDLGQRDVTRAQGTHTSTLRFALPKDISKGSYTLVTTISDGKNTKSARTPFAVV